MLIRMKMLMAGYAILSLATGSILGQLLQVDQRADAYGNWYYGIKTNAPMGQTFTPSSNAVGFVQFQMKSSGTSKLHVDLRGGGIAGPVIAQSRPQTVTNASFTVVLFEFGANVPVISGQLYCVEPIIDSGSDCIMQLYHYAYPRGEALLKGTPVSSITDMFFREGTVARFPSFDAMTALRNPTRVQMTLGGFTGQQIVVERSLDRVSWTPFHTNLFTNSPIVVTHSNTTAPAQFYRAFYQ